MFFLREGLQTEIDLSILFLFFLKKKKKTT